MYHALIIDSNQSRLALLHRTLTQSGAPFTFHLADDNDIMKQLINKDYSLVIINIEDQNIDGLSLCDSIRQFSTIPIILLGGVFNFQIIKQAMSYKINDMLISPYSSLDLLNSINNVYKEIKTERKKMLSVEFETYLDEKDTLVTNHVIDQVKSYVNKKLNQQITLKQISKQLHFNYAYLGQKFKSHENISFNEYLLQQRMERAKQLLIKTELKIYEVAQEVGYTEIDWFYKKFKAYTGLSANEYRKKHDFLYAN